MSKKSPINSDNYYLYPEWFGNESNQSNEYPTHYGPYTIQRSRKFSIASDNFCFYPDWFEGNQSNQSNQSQPSTSSHSYPTLEYIWSNAVRLTRATHSNLQDEIEYLEKNISGGNVSCNCSSLDYRISTVEEKIENIGSYTIIVYKDDTNIYAKDASGNIIAQGDANTDDVAVIQAAIDELPADGGAVILAAGRYHITQSINLRSFVSFSGYGFSTVLYVPSFTNPSYLPVIKMDGCTYSSIFNLKIDGNRDNQNSGREDGIYIKDGDHCKIINTWICNIYGTEGNGIYVEGIPKDFLIQGNIISDIQDDGLDINGMIKSQIISNNIHDCGDNGIDTEGTEYTTFSSNIIHDCGGSGLELEQEGTYPILTRYCTVTGNVIYNCEMDGIHVRSGGHNTISGNTIVNVSRYGIFFDKAGGDDAEYNIVIGNIILNSGSDSIYETSGNADFNFFGSNYLKGSGAYEEVISGLHTQSYNNFWADDYHYPAVERKIRLYKNYRTYNISAYSIVIKERNTHRPYAIDVTKNKGNELVLGVAIENISSYSAGFVMLEGKTKLRVNGSDNIYQGDFLGTSTELGVACKANSGDIAIAIALENYSASNGSGLIDVLVCTPRKIGSENASCNCSALQFGIDSNTSKIENLSTIKLSRDGSQSMTGLLKCESGLETDTITSYSGNIIECTDNLKVDGDVVGNSSDGLNLIAEDTAVASRIQLTPGTNSKLLLGTFSGQGIVPRIEVPEGSGNVDITIRGAHLVPYLDSDQGLGDSDKQWRHIYAKYSYFLYTKTQHRVWSNETLRVGYGTSSADITRIMFTPTDITLGTPDSNGTLTERITLTGGVDDSIVYIKNAHLLPYNNLSSYLGSTAHRWIEVFADRGSFAEVEGKDNLKLAGGDPSVGHAQIELHNGSAAPSPGALIFLTTNESGNPIERLKITGDWNIATLYVNKAHLEPYYDNSYRLGSSIYRWSDIYAVNTHWGDLGFVEDKCPKCNEKFKIGDNIVLKVIRFSEEDGGIMTIPIHLECAKLPTKTIRRKHPVKEKYYEWDERQGKVIAKWRIKKQKKKIKKKRLKPGYKINQKTGKIETSNRKNIELSEAIEEVEEEIEEIVYKEMEIKI